MLPGRIEGQIQSTRTNYFLKGHTCIIFLSKHRGGTRRISVQGLDRTECSEVCTKKTEGQYSPSMALALGR